MRSYVESWATGDVEARAALFADDAVMEDPAGTVRANGKAELREFLAAGIPPSWHLSFAFERVAVVGDEAILTYRITLTAGEATPAELLVNGHAVFDAQGLIRQYRTFFDADAITDLPPPAPEREPPPLP
ncbi:MAG: hypothetical protein JWL70_371 [Acidimicrobiia bacterium]|nr:hypothetical protein [Acidimicrobiia bacterium]